MTKKGAFLTEFMLSIIFSGISVVPQARFYPEHEKSVLHLIGKPSVLNQNLSVPDYRL